MGAGRPHGVAGAGPAPGSGAERPARRRQEIDAIAKKTPPSRKLWSGRFTGSLLPQLELFASSLETDFELYPYDIAGSVAHARGLKAAGLVSVSDLRAIEKGLATVKEELETGKFKFHKGDEDIHTAVERRLTELTPAGAKLHTGRSRNDQVALDLRMYSRAAAAEIAGALAGVIEALAEKARAHAAWPMPGYTHLQRAQPVTVGHHLLAHAEPLARDAERIRHAYAAADEMPLGSGALAGTTLPLQRATVARELGFARISSNSMDAVSDRDFALDLVYACLVIGIHLSRLGEDVVVWASSEFGFVHLADEIATGSSLMPQKKNPDVAELLRGRSGRALGSLAALSTVLKGLPMAYDRDLQEDKPAVFAAVDNAIDSLHAARLLVEHLEFNKIRLAEASNDAGLYATDSAEELVKEGTPFRRAHEAVGRAVREGRHRAPWGPAQSLRKRDIEGAPHPRRVAQRATAIRRQAAQLAAWSRSHPPPPAI